MTLREKLLQKLSEWRPASEGRHSLAVADEATGGTVRLAADRSDELGCLVWELTCQRGGPAKADLGAWAKSVAQRVTGLLEPLKVVEVDNSRGEALLRSNEPSRRGDSLSYYELLLAKRGEATVRRYQSNQQAGSRREQVTFALTHEVLAKFASDLAAGE